MKNSLHGEYMYVHENALVVKDGMIDHVNNLFNEGLIIEDIKLLYEDEDTFLWKDGKNWREMVGSKEVSNEFTLDQTIAV